MDDVTIFRKDEFGTVRVLEEDGRTLFCGSDVARALGYARPNDEIASHCRATVKHSTPISGKMQEINFIPEGDVYRLITHSKLPEAEKFESWVFDEVIPAIRKTGGYIAVQETMDDDQLLANALLVAQRKIAERSKQLEAAHAKIEADAPKVLFAETVQKAQGDILVRNMAKLLKQRGVNTGEHRLFERLRKDGWLISKEGRDHNLPTQKSMEMGLMRIVERTQVNSSGAFISQTPVITPKGQIYFISRYAPKAQAVQEEMHIDE